MRCRGRWKSERPCRNSPRKPRMNASSRNSPAIVADIGGSNAPLPSAQGCMAVIGPGTGLGVAGVAQTAHGWIALPGEGGHATLAAADDFEHALLAEVHRTHAHVSAERLLSGIGLPLLHGA